ncbi:MAG: dTMP kinase [Hyphomicrobiales bacterium]|nr:dTMP kinase [Hyphomicrobiales bacterium]
MARGRFITLEGGEGAGKSTQAKLLCDRLDKEGVRTLLTREPGGTPRAEAIRDILLSGKAKPLGPMGEALLFYVARDSHLELTIRPALKRGVWVICDRFHDSTRAYQGAAGGVPVSALDALERIIIGDTQPDLTLILDLPPEEGLIRAKARAESAGQAVDRFEEMSLRFHRNLRDEFLDIAGTAPERCVVIDAPGKPDDVAYTIWKAVVERLGS